MPYWKSYYHTRRNVNQQMKFCAYEYWTNDEYFCYIKHAFCILITHTWTNETKSNRLKLKFPLNGVKIHCEAVYDYNTANQGKTTK